MNWWITSASLIRNNEKESQTYANSETSDRESHLFGGWRSIFAAVDNVCWWTLRHPALALPSDTLSGTKTRVLLSTQPCLHEDNSSSVNLAQTASLSSTTWTLLALKKVRQKQKADRQIGKSIWHYILTVDRVTGSHNINAVICSSITSLNGIIAQWWMLLLSKNWRKKFEASNWEAISVLEKHVKLNLFSKNRMNALTDDLNFSQLEKLLTVCTAAKFPWPLPFVAKQLTSGDFLNTYPTPL